MQFDFLLKLSEINYYGNKVNDMNYEFADIEIYIQGQGSIIKEKSLIAYELDTNKILAIGTEAQSYIYRTLKNVNVISPLRQGVVADFNASVILFTHLMQKAWGKKTLFKPSVAVCVSSAMTEVERKALEDVFVQSGVKQVFINETSIEELLKNSDAKYKLIFNITKYDSQAYIIEELQHLLSYAKQAGVSVDRVKELLTNISVVS